MFKKGQIWAYPTDTSFGLGVRADDEQGLINLANLKSREKNMFFSLMVRDIEMLREFSEVPKDFPVNFFTEKPRTVILKPKNILPESGFWPTESVAFRVCTIPEISREIVFPITATSANLSGKSAIYSVAEIREIFGNNVEIYEEIKELPVIEASEIWNFAVEPVERVR